VDFITCAASSRENQEELVVQVYLEIRVKKVVPEFLECRVSQVPKDPLAWQDFQASVYALVKQKLQ